MKKSFFAIAALVALTILTAGRAFAAPSDNAPDVSELLDARQADVWVEGERLGDLVIGARGAIQMIYVDEQLSRAITADSRLQDWSTIWRSITGRTRPEKRDWLSLTSTYTSRGMLTIHKYSSAIITYRRATCSPRA